MTTQSSTTGGSVDIVAVVGMGLGALVVVYGVLILSVSPLGGLHIAAIGLSLLLASLFTTEWAGNRWSLSPTTRNKLSWGFLTLTAVLTMAFVVINFVGFGGPFVESGSASGS